MFNIIKAILVQYSLNIVFVMIFSAPFLRKIFFDFSALITPIALGSVKRGLKAKSMGISKVMPILD